MGIQIGGISKAGRHFAAKQQVVCADKRHPVCVKTTDLNFKVSTLLQLPVSTALSVLYTSGAKAIGVHSNTAYLPRGCIPSEVGKHPREPVVDFI